MPGARSRGPCRTSRPLKFIPSEVGGHWRVLCRVTHSVFTFHSHCCVNRSGGVGVGVFQEKFKGEIRQEVSAGVKGTFGGGMDQGDRRGGGWIVCGWILGMF